jgi:iron complex transport system ATP-binding protein
MLLKADNISAQTVFQFKNIGHKVGEKWLVQNCNFDVKRGSFMGLLGPNGAGKSSLLRLVYREHKPSTGTITAFGKSLAQWGRKEFAAKVSTVLQEKAQLSGLTIHQVVALGLFPANFSASEEEKRIQSALELVELWDRRDENAGKLSGGEQQRLFFAQVLALDPEVYLLDEPNNHLDLYFQIRLLDHIKAKGKTVIASFHDMNLAARYCDDAVLMNKSEVHSHGALHDVLSQQHLNDVFRVDAQLVGDQLSLGKAIA